MIISNLPARFVLIPLLILSGLVTGGCDKTGDAGKAGSSEAKQAPPHVVETTRARIQSVQSQLTTSGTPSITTAQRYQVV